MRPKRSRSEHGYNSSKEKIYTSVTNGGTTGSHGTAPEQSPCTGDKRATVPGTEKCREQHSKLINRRTSMIICNQVYN